MPRVLITGARDWPAINVATVVTSRLVERYGRGSLTIVHGGAAGVDAAFDELARAWGLAVEVHPADWKALGKKAGPIRNQAMVDAGADFAIAVHRSLGWSKGTADCVRRCLAASIPAYWIRDNDCAPVRVLRLDGHDVIVKEAACAPSAAS